jgi:hypothetical protein
MDDLPSDELLLDRAFRTLKSSGRIEYTGEYGDEVAAFIPFVSWLKQEGHLNGPAGRHLPRNAALLFLSGGIPARREG